MSDRLPFVTLKVEGAIAQGTFAGQHSTASGDSGLGLKIK